jgi:hypothetical protein
MKVTVQFDSGTGDLVVTTIGDRVSQKTYKAANCIFERLTESVPDCDTGWIEQMDSGRRRITFEAVEE